MITVYTAIFNWYDELLPVIPQDIACNFVLFTDRPRYTNQWKLHINIPELEWLPPHLKSRYCKTHSHSLIDWPSIWIDGNVIIKRPDFVRTILNQYEWWLLCLKNDERNSIAEEMDILWTKARFKDDVDKIEEQRQAYIEDWYKFDNGLSWNCILMRDNTPEIAKFNELWREEINKHCYRDMLSMEYCSRKTWVPIHHLPRVGVQNDYMNTRYHARPDLYK